MWQTGQALTSESGCQRGRAKSLSLLDVEDVLAVPRTVLLRPAVRMPVRAVRVPSPPLLLVRWGGMSGREAACGGEKVRSTGVALVLPEVVVRPDGRRPVGFGPAGLGVGYG